MSFWILVGFLKLYTRAEAISFKMADFVHLNVESHELTWTWERPKKCKTMNWHENSFVCTRWIQYPPILTESKGGVLRVDNVCNTHNTYRNTHSRKRPVICEHNVFGLRPRYLQSSRLVKLALQFKPCPIFWPLFQTDSKQYPFYTPQYKICIGVEI